MIKNVTAEINMLTQKRTMAEKNIEEIITRLSKPYEETLAANKRKELAWTAFDAKLQSDMSLYSEAYRRIQNDGKALQLVPKLKYLALPFIVMLMLLIGCSRSYASDWLVLCDRSSSSLNVCNKDVLKEAIRGWLQEASTDDKFEIFVIGGDIYDVKLAYAVAVPKFNSPVTKNKAQWKKTIAKEMDAIELHNAGKSAMFQAIWRASQKINKKDSALILISDLRHVDKRYNFERKIPESKEFIKYLKDQGIWDVGLTGHRVYICGFHPNEAVATGAPTAKNLMQIKTVWKEVFSSWGIKVPIKEECRFRDFQDERYSQ